MAFKSVLKIFGIRMRAETVVKFAFYEISILAIIYFGLIIARYAYGAISHELFIELLIIIGVGMSFDHYAVATLNLKK